MSCKYKKSCSCKKTCQCTKCKPCKCNKCKCNCPNRWQWVKFPTCRDKNINDVYEFLGKFVYDLLIDMDLPCDDKELEELILRAILEDDKSLCKTAKKICCEK